MKGSVIILIVLLCSCHNSSQPIDKEQNNLTTKRDLKKINSTAKRFHTTHLLKESYSEEDLAANEYLTERLKPIRENFKKINSILSSEWSLVLTKDIWGKSTEGGEATFYYNNNNLNKIIERYFWEHAQWLNEYYLLNGKLSFVFEKSCDYNRPIYWDSTVMKESNDNEVFDFDKSKIIETRNYFENGELIHQIYSQDCGAPFADDYLLGEQKRITANFDSLIVLSQKK